MAARKVEPLHGACGRAGDGEAVRRDGGGPVAGWKGDGPPRFQPHFPAFHSVFSTSHSFLAVLVFSAVFPRLQALLVSSPAVVAEAVVGRGGGRRDGRVR